MSYRIGLPGWRIAARAGLLLSLRVEVHFDPESNTYWANSPDLDGLVVEGATLDLLVTEINDCVGMLLEEHLHAQPKHPPRTRMDIGALAHYA